MVLSLIIGLLCLSATPSVSMADSPKVVSLYAGHSESLLALGYGDRLVGVSQSDDPDLFPGRVRLPVRFDPESIIALSPDLVLIRPMIETVNRRAVETLRRSGLTVISIDPSSWDGLEDYVRRLSELMGGDAVESVAKLRVEISELAEMSSERRGDREQKVYFLETGEGGVRTCSPASWAAGVLSLAGLENGAPDAEPIKNGSPLAYYGLERLLSLSSKGLDLYIVQKGTMNDVEEDDVIHRPWMKAFKGTELVFIDERDLTRPSLFRLEKTVRMLVERAYGEKR